MSSLPWKLGGKFNQSKSDEKIVYTFELCIDFGLHNAHEFS